MKYKLTIGLLLVFSLQSFGWGSIGHRVIGQIAYNHLSNKAKKKIEKLLAPESLAMTGTFMDEIRSDPQYDSLKYWHYCTIPDGKTYEEAGTPMEGDVIMGIKKFTSDLKSGTLSREQEIFALKCLEHLVGDIHQPLHVGNGNDRGGNDVDVTYFWEPSNLHRVWDEGIIEQQKLGYQEYASWIDHPTKEQVDEWQHEGIMVWAQESMSLRPQIYDLPENKKINYQYNYHNISDLNKRLLQAGIRLAGILNEIYG